MAGGLDFAGMVPGFDFLQNLMKGAGAALPPMGQWVAPTLDPAELEKRIGELRTVQFWLEQNAKLLGATIQAMEVQRMTLATLQTMNMPMAELRDALTIKMPAASAFASPFGAAAPAPAPSPAPAEPAPEPEPEPEPPAPAAAAAAAAAPIDPMKWWGALTQQFTEIASQAIQAGAGDVTAAGKPDGAAPARPSARGASGSAGQASAKASAKAPGKASGRASGRASGKASSSARAPARARKTAKAAPRKRAV